MLQIRLQVKFLKCLKICFWKENVVQRGNVSETSFQKFRKFHLRTTFSLVWVALPPNFERCYLCTSVGKSDISHQTIDQVFYSWKCSITQQPLPDNCSNKSSTCKRVNSWLISRSFFAAVSKDIVPQPIPNKMTKPCELETVRTTMIRNEPSYEKNKSCSQIEAPCKIIRKKPND